MALPGFLYCGGPYELDQPLTTDSTAIGLMDAVESESGRINPADAGDKIVGVALESQGAATTGNTVQTLLIQTGRTRFLGPRESGTLAVADVRTRIDLASPDGLAADVTTNGDYFVERRVDADTAKGVFSDPAWTNATN